MTVHWWWFVLAALGLYFGDRTAKKLYGVFLILVLFAWAFATYGLMGAGLSLIPIVLAVKGWEEYEKAHPLPPKEPRP